MLMFLTELTMVLTVIVLEMMELFSYIASWSTDDGMFMPKRICEGNEFC
jgi:hypothetical protein